MTERPILFNGEMVRAILAGRKTQTRRIVKPQPPSVEAVRARTGSGFHLFTDDDSPGAFRIAGPVGVACDLAGLPNAHQWRCPYGALGARLWVRETFSYVHGQHSPQHASEMPVHYWADGNPEHGDWTRPKPSIHMPRWASRLTLEVTAVRVEKLHLITEADALAEGIESDEYLEEQEFAQTVALPPGTTNLPTPRNWYRRLWEQINGEGSWDANPWVWVIEFTRVTP